MFCIFHSVWLRRQARVATADRGVRTKGGDARRSTVKRASADPRRPPPSIPCRPTSARSGIAERDQLLVPAIRRGNV